METLRYVVLANGLLLVVSVAYYVLLRRETFFEANRLVLWLGVAASLLLPLLQLPDWRPQPVKVVMQRTARVIVPRLLPAPVQPRPNVTITMPDGRAYRAFSDQAPRPAGWSWQTILALVYGSVVLMLLVRFTSQLLSLRQLIARSAHEPYTDFVLVKNPAVASPFSFFRWVVLNPDQHTPDELDQILRHERVHVRAWHSADMLGAELLCVIGWANPAVYLFRYLLRQTLEFAADRAVLNEGVDARAYQYNLVKVSLSGGHAELTNHFSHAQLKTRIAMLNKQTSSRLTWLKYPLLMATVLVVTAAFARHQLTHSPKLSASIVSAIGNSSAVNSPVSAAPESIAFPDVAGQTKETDSLVTPSALSAELVHSQPVANSQTSGNDTAHVSPSRYMHYEGNQLYWIVTPKTTFDDFVVMKKEFDKWGNGMQINELKYDPLYAYITRINFTVKRASGGQTNCSETADDAKPIPTIAGFVGIGLKSNSSGTGGLRHYKSEFPESLRLLAAEDEKAAEQFVNAHRTDYLILEGEQKFNELGRGGSTYAKSYIQANPTQNNSGVIINTDGSLGVKEALGNVKVYVNNVAVGRAALSQIKVDQLSTVVQKTQYNPARNESFISALLIYTTNDN